MNRVVPRHTFTFAGTTHNIFHCDTGFGLPRHDHDFPHATVCHSGSIVIRKEGREVIITKDSTPVVLTANEWHEIEAIEDGTVFENIFVTNTTNK